MQNNYVYKVTSKQLMFFRKRFDNNYEKGGCVPHKINLGGNCYLVCYPALDCSCERFCYKVNSLDEFLWSISCLRLLGST